MLPGCCEFSEHQHTYIHILIKVIRCFRAADTYFLSVNPWVMKQGELWKGKGYVGWVGHCGPNFPRDLRPHRKFKSVLRLFTINLLFSVFSVSLLFSSFYLFLNVSSLESITDGPLFFPLTTPPPCSRLLFRPSPPYCLSMGYAYKYIHSLVKPFSHLPFPSHPSPRKLDSLNFYSILEQMKNRTRACDALLPWLPLPGSFCTSCFTSLSLSFLICNMSVT